jgi:hypothetical protein
MIAWPPPADDIADENVIVPGGLVLTVVDGDVQCITKAMNDARSRPLGLRRSTLPASEVGVLNNHSGEPAEYTRRTWRCLAKELRARNANLRRIDEWARLIATLSRLG